MDDSCRECCSEQHNVCTLDCVDQSNNYNIYKKQETYIGLTENEFKTRFNLHKSSFKLEHKRTTTTLSDHIWKLKKKNTDYNIKWEIIKNVKPYAPGEKICRLCLQEKLSILISKPSLNKRSEIFGHCVHRKQFLLNNIKEQYTPPVNNNSGNTAPTNNSVVWRRSQIKLRNSWVTTMTTSR